MSGGVRRYSFLSFETKDPSCCTSHCHSGDDGKECDQSSLHLPTTHHRHFYHPLPNHQTPPPKKTHIEVLVRDVALLLPGPVHVRKDILFLLLLFSILLLLLLLLLLGVR